jgi:mRNA interferase MazF
MDIPERGDIILTNLSPTSGREQSGFRPCVVLSHFEFNRSLKMVYICAITSKIKGNNFEVHINTDKTKGVAMAHQVKVIDLSSRKYSIVDKVTENILVEILKKIKKIID